MSPAPDWGRASSAGFAGAIEIWGRHRRGPRRPPPTKTCRAARRRPSHAPPSGAPTIQWAGVARERSLVLPVLLTAIVGLGALSIDMFLPRSEEHTSELQSQSNLVCRLLLEKKKKNTKKIVEL